MTCPICHDTGLRRDQRHPSGVPCDCGAGQRLSRAILAEWRANQMNAELPEADRAMLKLKGML